VVANPSQINGDNLQNLRCDVKPVEYLGRKGNI
jgi:hypothetical protein